MNDQQHTKNHEDKIAAIENGLLSPIALAGKSQEPMRLQDRMAHYQVPGVSITVIDNGEIAWSKGYGVVKAGSQQPVTPNTLFQAASISKPISTVGAMCLADEGKLSDDEDVNQYLKRWQIPPSDAAPNAKITLRQLASHTAGFTVPVFGGYAKGDPVPDTLSILNGETPANSPAVRLAWPPGEMARYSGGGFTIMQLMMEDITGEPFAELMRRLVLGPTGMSRSTFSQPLPVPLVERAAMGHNESGNTIIGGFHTYPELAAAGLWTTTEDLARLALAVMVSYQGKPQALLKRETAHHMLQRHVSEWGSGFVVGEATGDNLSFAHGGGNKGFRSFLFAYVNGRGVAILTNGDRGEALYPEILTAIAKAYDWPGYQQDVRTTATLLPQARKAVTGTYVPPNASYKIRVGEDENGLWMKLDDEQFSTALYPTSAKAFFTLNGRQIDFIFDDSGSAKSMHMGPWVAMRETVKNRC